MLKRGSSVRVCQFPRVADAAEAASTQETKRNSPSLICSEYVVKRREANETTDVFEASVTESAPPGKDSEHVQPVKDESDRERVFPEGTDNQSAPPLPAGHEQFTHVKLARARFWVRERLITLPFPLVRWMVEKVDSVSESVPVVK